VAGMAASVVIIFKAISPIIGAVIIPLYLSNFSISISPAPDLSQQSQQIIGFELIALLAAGVGLFLLPFFPTYSVQPETLNGLPNLFGMRDISPDTPRRVLLPDRGTFFNFLSDYMPFYFTFLFMNLIVIPIDLYFEIPIQKIMPWTLTSSFVISAIVLYIFKLKGRGLKFSTYIGFLVDLMWSNYTAIVGMLAIEVILLTIWQHGIADTAGSKEKVVI
jgi:hypothetical protein